MNTRDRRAVTVGGAVIAIALAVLWVVPSVVSGARRLQERVVARQETLDNAHNLLASQQLVRDSLEVVLARFVLLAPKLIAGPTPTDAAASLAAALQGLAARHALRVTRLESTPDSVGGPIRCVTAHLELEGDVHSLAALLASIEAGNPLLTVRALAVTAPEPGSPARSPERLRITLTVAGWYFNGNPS